MPSTQKETCQWLIDNCLIEIDGNNLNESVGTCSICREPLQCYALSESSSIQTSSKYDKTTDSESKESQPLSDAPAVDENKPETTVRIKACGHVFGRECITEWLHTSTTCPMCRISLEPPLLDRWRKLRSRIFQLVDMMIRESYINDSATVATVQLNRTKQWMLRKISPDGLPDTLTTEVYLDLILNPWASIDGVNDRDYTD